MKRHDIELLADYQQFYLQDEPASGDLSEAWSQEAVDRLLAVGSSVVGVGTASAAIVPVTIELLESAPLDDLVAFDRVNECSLVIAQGPMVVAGCTDYFPEAIRIPIDPGTYRVRVSYLGLCNPALERYRVQLWLAPAIEPTVLKAGEA